MNEIKIAENKKVTFSSGNLQYQASTNTWRFAENQWDYIGDANQNISTMYSGWIDLFGWGTGDVPTKISKSVSDFSSFTDWGINLISNGGNTSNSWRTLSKDECLVELYLKPTPLFVNEQSCTAIIPPSSATAPMS